MTVIAYRAGVMATDSLSTVETEAGGIRKFQCEKLYRKGEAIIGTAGETYPGLRFVEWYGSKKKKRPELLVTGEADFTALVLTPEGLFEYDKWCTPEKVILPPNAPFYAVGCGAKAALGAMHAGATAEDAVRFTCEIDPLCGLPVVSMTLTCPQG